MVIKIILTVVMFADVVKNHSREEVRVLQGLASLHRQESLYSVGGSFDLSDISSSQYNQAFREHRRMTSQCSYRP